MEKRDWKKVVADSKGSMVFVPGKLVDNFRAYNLKRKKFLEEVEKISEMEIRMQVEVNNMMLEARTIIDKEMGIKVWKKDLGLNEQALEDGELVLNISNPMG